MLADAEFSLFISQTVVSEFYFHALAAFGNKSPLSLKSSGSIGAIMQSHRPQQFLNLFEFLVDDAQLIDTSGQLMERYNLLPNDALILSTCKYHAIQHVAGYDITDFESVCKEENMILISSILELKTVFV